ncbi:MAG: DNA-binding response regulator [Planctomycetota bacterium]|nr:MAG: DNA-binding response regulator [Planctomycetota bacterium]
MQPSIPLFIVHPKELIRAGLAAMVDGAGFRVVGSMATAAEALAEMGHSGAVVALVDTDLPDSDGFSLVRRLTEVAPGVRVVLFSQSGDDIHMARARAVGAVNCMSKTSSSEELVIALRDAATDQPPSATAAFGAVAAKMHSPQATGLSAHLTSRERQVLCHLAYGLANDEIATSLKIGIETVKTHVHKLLRKMAVRDRTQAAVWAVKNGFT